MSQRGWGRRRCARFLAAHEISERKLPRDLTVRQREQLSAEVDRVSGQRPAIDPILLQVRKLSGGQKWQPVATDGSEAKRIAREQPAVVVACVRVGDRIAVSDAHQAEPVTSRTSRRTGAGVAQLDRVDLAACECQYKPYPGGHGGLAEAVQARPLVGGELLYGLVPHPPAAIDRKASVLDPYLGHSEFENHGRRVVEGQRLMQGASDTMLGWIRTTEWINGVNRDFYVRQLWGGKGSAPIDVLDPDALGRYGELCGWA